MLGIAGLTLGIELDEGLGDLGDFGADLWRDTFAEVLDLDRIGAAPEELGSSSRALRRSHRPHRPLPPIRVRREGLILAHCGGVGYGFRTILMAPSCFFWKIS